MHPDSANARWQKTCARAREQHRQQTRRVEFNLGDSKFAALLRATEVMDGLLGGLGDSTTRLADEFAESADKFVDAIAATFGSTVKPKQPTPPPTPKGDAWGCSTGNYTWVLNPLGTFGTKEECQRTCAKPAPTPVLPTPHPHTCERGERGSR